MDDMSINNLISYSALSGLTSSATKTGSAGTTDDFSSMLMMMMSSMGQTGSASGEMNSSMMMLPLMVQLMEKLQSGGLVSAPKGDPVNASVTQSFSSSHRGVDFGVDEGTPVKATMSGKVVYAGWNDDGYGNLVIVENGPFRTYYGHLSEIPVSVGEEVTAGNIVGLSGNTGNSTGPHVHYEVHKNGTPVNPQYYYFKDLNAKEYEKMVSISSNIGQTFD